MTEADLTLTLLVTAYGLLCAILLAVLVPFASQHNTTTYEGRHRVRYNPVFKACIGIICLLMCTLIAVSLCFFNNNPLLALLVQFNALLILAFYPYQVFFIRLSFDAEYLYYASPLCKERKIPWHQLRSVGYSWVLMSDYIKVSGLGRIWINSAQHGYHELMLTIRSQAAKMYNSPGSGLLSK